MSDQAPTPQNAVTQAAGDVPAVEQAAAAVVTDVHDAKLPSEAEIAAATHAVDLVYTDTSAVVKEAKAGYKTTEFWLTTVLAVLTLLGTFPLPGKFEAVVAGALTAAYTVSRGLAKAGVANVEPDQRA
jgi:hypothetical protein